MSCALTPEERLERRREYDRKRNKSESRKAWRRRHYAENRDEICASAREYYKENLEARRAYDRKRNDSEHRRAQKRASDRRNAPKVRERSRNWYRAHIEDRRDYDRARSRTGHRQTWQREWRRRRFKESPGVKIAHAVRGRVLAALSGRRKSAPTEELIGTTFADLRVHLEKQFKPGMSWDNHGRGEGKWHIDHIRPCASFDLAVAEQQKQCFHYTNLQPLWEKENLIKGASVVAYSAN